MDCTSRVGREGVDDLHWAKVRSGVPGMSGLWGGLFIITLAVQEATRRFAGPWLASCGCRRTVVQSPCLGPRKKRNI